MKALCIKEMHPYQVGKVYPIYTCQELDGFYVEYRTSRGNPAEFSINRKTFNIYFKELK